VITAAFFEMLSSRGRSFSSRSRTPATLMANRALDFAVVFVVFFLLSFVGVFAVRFTLLPTASIEWGPHISGPQFTHWSAVAVRKFSVRSLHVRRSASPQVRNPHFTRVQAVTLVMCVDRLNTSPAR